ncbi:XRE family transcriptional regulator [Paracoccus alkanivorans]|uniref:XRE family transcriptional regulator n=1 Tax=Paracoccus alkanivorans TaxID=2116655 RepID=A0A3M0M808_9RHOB|nr:XRE family transcriptional regulator [Paracoccus alkanivorans]RMC33928.1 XRE family transcriptional regulator [Paracoccus alkanivorans]
MTLPYEDSAAAAFLSRRILELKPKKTQRQIGQEAGFQNATMLNNLKRGHNKIPIDRVPALAKALEADLKRLMLFALEQSVGQMATNAIAETFGHGVTANESAWIDEIRDASSHSDPRLTTRSRIALRVIFGK